MAKLGSEKRPVVVRVHTDEKARYVAETCAKNGWHYIIGFEPNKPEDIPDLEKLLNLPQLVKSEKIGRNDPSPCRSGKKYKKCSGANNFLWNFALTRHSTGRGTACFIFSRLTYAAPVNFSFAA
jgi:SWIM/SEC-C metal-binding protein